MSYRVTTSIYKILTPIGADKSAKLTKVKVTVPSERSQSSNCVTVHTYVPWEVTMFFW